MDALRRAIRAAAPDADETIAYNMPAFRTRGGRFLVSYDAYKAHYSLFPFTDEMVATYGEELAPYLAGKGTIRFPADRRSLRTSSGASSQSASQSSTSATPRPDAVSSGVKWLAADAL